MSTSRKSSSALPVITHYVTAPPHESIQEVLTRAPYPLPNALAELVDNSLDANASYVCIRFRRNEQRAFGIQVIDNGDGIAESSFTKAMTFATKSQHKSTDIGMYGVGLKTAALSQAEILNVYSKTKRGIPHGRQWQKTNLSKERLGVLDDEFVRRRFESTRLIGDNPQTSESGTIVELEQVTDLERSVYDPEKYLKETTQDVISHLGLYFHRFLERDKVEMWVEIEEADQIVGKFAVSPINPFKYPRPGARGWPKKFKIKVPRPNSTTEFITLNAVAHIWPKGNNLEGYKIRRLGKTSASEFQGLYFYLNDRIISAGDWANARVIEAHVSLARMEIELTTEAQTFIEIAYTKDDIKTPASFSQAIRNATSDDGTSFAEWTKVAQEVYRTRSLKSVKLPDIPLPGTWVRQSVRSVFEDSPFPKGNPINIHWARLTRDLVIKVDHDRDRILLNKFFQPEIERHLRSSTQSELFKVLLMLSLKDHFGHRQSGRLKEEARLINDLLRTMFI